MSEQRQDTAVEWAEIDEQAVEGLAREYERADRPHPALLLYRAMATIRAMRKEAAAEIARISGIARARGVERDRGVSALQLIRDTGCLSQRHEGTPCDMAPECDVMPCNACIARAALDHKPEAANG